jgi:nucleoside-diphosphate-sugar epimerase
VTQPTASGAPGSPARRKKVLITGAAGRIGKFVADYLRERFADRYALRLMYHHTVLPAQGDDEVVVCNLEDLEAVKKACEGVDGIIHMAANPSGRATWEQVLNANIIGTYNVFEAARLNNVPKIVFASTNHVTGWYEIEKVYTTPDLPVRPDSYYGVSKAFGEALGRYYSDAFGISIICLRIGSFLPKPTSMRALSTWSSPRDTAQLCWRALESPLRFAVVYCISGNTRRYWDISSAQELLGYQPEDNAEEYAAEIESAARG